MPKIAPSDASAMSSSSCIQVESFEAIEEPIKPSRPVHSILLTFENISPSKRNQHFQQGGRVADASQPL
jgi:hypothetical protein